MLRAFADGRPPDLEALATESARRELKLDHVVEALWREDLVHLDAEGVVGAYPFSGRPTSRRVRIDGREAYPMCAIAALGDRAHARSARRGHLGRPDRRQSRPYSAQRRRLGEPAPSDGRRARRTRLRGPAFSRCGEVLKSFARQENAERYLCEHPGVRGFPISIPAAIEAGRLLFGDALRGD